MTTAAWVLLAVAGVLAGADWVARGRGLRALEYVCKPATMVALIGVAFTLDPRHADTRAWFVVAASLCLAGDVFLMLPADRFVAGLAAFLLAHVAYTVGLNLHGGTVAQLVAAAVPVLAYDVVVGSRVLPAARRAAPRIVAPMVAYLVVISAMATSALAGQPWLAGAGAVLFVFSDSLIAETRFVRPHRGAPVAIMVTYHLGQAGLVLSLVR